MGKSVKRSPKRQAHLRLVSERQRAKTAELSERRAGTAGRFVTGLVADMVRGQMTPPAMASRKGGKVVPLLASEALAAALTSAPTGGTADVTDELSDGSQSFGEVLKAIGRGVVLSQAALDEAAIESAKMLSQTKLEVTVAIKQPLNDDGNIDNDPEKSKPDIDSRNLSLSSFILPTLHQWQHVAVSMDLTVGEIDATSGVKVKSGGASAGVSAGGGGFSAAAAFNYSSIDAESRFKADFSSGTVRFDALLGPREEFRFPEVADFEIGPRILVTQSAEAKPAVPASQGLPAVPAKDAVRKVTLTVKIQDKDGKKLDGKSVEVRLPAELRRRLKAASTGEIQTPVDIVLDIDPKFIVDPPQSFRIQLKFGDVVKMVDVTI